MATLPSANVSLNNAASAFAGGTGLLVVMGCVAQSADSIPRVFSSTQDLLDQYDYAPAVDECAIHFAKTRKPVIFMGLPITTQGGVGSVDTTGVTGSSAVTFTAGASGCMEQTDGIFTVTAGGTIGTDQISGLLSLDNGVTSVPVRVGTADSYTIPNIGLTINFGAGTLNVADVVLFRTTAPMWGSTAIQLARENLSGQQQLARSWLVVGDVPNSTFAGYVVTEANNYATENQRFTYARMQVPDRLPLARKSKVTAETLTFVASGKTITRSAGSWLADGFSATPAGMSVSFAGTASNNVTVTIASLSATVMTVNETIVNETVNSNVVTALQVETASAHVAAQTTAFATVDAEPAVDIGYGRLRVQSPILGYQLRRPVQWGATAREYQHDVQIPCWRKADGPLDGFSLADVDGNIVEFDERVIGGALAGRFTCARTYGNGPIGAFIALSLTRADEGSLLSRTHNMAVACLAQTVVQAETENAIGQVLVLNADGTATKASRSLIEQRVNSALQINLLQAFDEGPRASSAVWTANPNDVLNEPGATMHGTLALELNGTLEEIDTAVVVQTAGA